MQIKDNEYETSHEGGEVNKGEVVYVVGEGGRNDDSCDI